ncbi:DUF402 domain-containing protein [Pseudofrankia saprophytica]|uniref:DUF402 domain-containing protein n=1 Tax=Pseudofrankia saprophytica TaxID=298655 RepID=UPI00031C85A0|nr:DUF402 domain-containing protein [Pseudofrankia saprophytica]
MDHGGPPFEPGELILHRMFTDDELVFVRCGVVVGDDERGLRVWIPHGGPAAVRMSEDGRGIRDMPFAEWITQRTVLTRTTWWGPDIFMLIPPDRAHSVWWFWDWRGQFDAWYVNLEEPVTRWRDGDGAVGVDGCDQDLDIWVWPDRGWEWKDEDELEERLAFPDRYWVRDAAAVRAEGERLIKDVEAGLFPFDGTWHDFRPEPAWRALPFALTPGWDRPRTDRRAP